MRNTSEDAKNHVREFIVSLGMIGHTPKDDNSEDVDGMLELLHAHGFHYNDEVKELMHHKDTTVNLWATDRPELIPVKLKKEFFFKIEYTGTPSPPAPTPAASGEEPSEKCASCGGSGRDNEGRRTCSSCHGTGQAPKKEG